MPGGVRDVVGLNGVVVKEGGRKKMDFLVGGGGGGLWVVSVEEGLRFVGVVIEGLSFDFISHLVLFLYSVIIRDISINLFVQSISDQKIRKGEWIFLKDVVRYFFLFFFLFSFFFFVSHFVSLCFSF